jgi:FkbM family methyltransferase
MIKRAARSALGTFKLFGAKGALKRTLIRLPGINCEHKARIPNSARHVIVRLGTTDVAAFEHVFVDDEYGFSFARPPSTIIDAGANVGMSAAYFALRYPAATIVAIEPDRANFEMLGENAKLFPTIHPINAALWNHEDFVRIEDGGTGSWGKRVAIADVFSEGTIPATTIPLLLERLAIDRVDLLKVDVEGAECEIFEDASKWIPCVDAICIELHDRFRPGCARIFEAATKEFPVKWRRGELHCVAREGLISAF